MNSPVWLAVAALIIFVAIAIGVWLYTRQYRSRRLKERFGPEYQRTINALHDQNLAETELQRRERRVRLLHVVPLSEADRDLYAEKWITVQNRFVDDPKTAVQQAHQLIFEVMNKRGYPTTNFEQAAADLSVEYPDLVSNYRAASRIAENNRRGAVKTEELRQALVYYRALFKELLQTHKSEIDREGGLQQKTPAGERSQPTHGGGLRT